jgi:hypothetical protein
LIIISVFHDNLSADAQYCTGPGGDDCRDCCEEFHSCRQQHTSSDTLTEAKKDSWYGCYGEYSSDTWYGGRGSSDSDSYSLSEWYTTANDYCYAKLGPEGENKLGPGAKKGVECNCGDYWCGHHVLSGYWDCCYNDPKCCNTNRCRNLGQALGNICAKDCCQHGADGIATCPTWRRLEEDSTQNNDLINNEGRRMRN